MRASLGLLEVELRAPHDHVTAVIHECVEVFAQIHQLGLAIVERKHDYAESFCELRQLEKAVLDYFYVLALAAFDHNAHTGAVGLISDVADTFDLLFANEAGDFLHELRFIHLIRNLVNHDHFFVALAFFHFHFGAHFDDPAASAIGVLDAFTAADIGSCREIGTLHDLHQIIDGNFTLFHAATNHSSPGHR